MKISSLSTDQAPPISVPLRFFAVAPCFLVLVALLSAFSGGEALADFPATALIAATHLITLGFITLVMLGALQQLLPVVIGSPMPVARWLAWFILLPLLAGTLLLSGAFASGEMLLLGFAWPLLALAFLVFIGASLTSLARAPSHNAIGTAILLSIFSLAAAITLGLLLARGYAHGMAMPYPHWAAAHIGLALGGWILLLVIGVSYQVVPMFQLTPNYPGWLMTLLAPLLFTLVMANAALHLFAPDWLPARFAVELLFWLLAGAFAVTTLLLQSRRRRRVPDVTLSFFRLGMTVLLLCGALSLAAWGLPAAHDSLHTLAVLLFLLGFALSLIHGMLYKIIPFLVWFHLFRGGMKTGVPNMKNIIPEVWMKKHLWLHGTTLLVAPAALWWQAAAWLLILGLLLQGILLGCAVLKGVAVYRRTLRRLIVSAP